MKTATLGAVLGLLLAGATAAESDRSVWRADTRATVPRTLKPPTCDGRIRDPEWATAWRYDSVLNPVSMNLFPRPVQWYIAWDDDHIHIACRTALRQGESPKMSEDDGDVSLDGLLRTDSVEIWLSAPETAATLRLGIDLAGRLHSQASGFGKEDPSALRPVGAASVHDGLLDVEISIPVAAFGRGRGNRVGDTWRILGTRSFQAGASLRTLLPNGTGERIQDTSLHPLFTLTRDTPFVRVGNPGEGLYDGRAVADLAITNPATTPTKATVALRIAKPADKGYVIERVMALPAGKTVALRLDEAVTPAIDPEVEAERRYTLTVGLPTGETLLHTHFIYDPTDSREWLGDALPQPGRAGERELLIDPSKGGIPFKFQRQCSSYTELPEGHRIRLTVRHMWEPSKLHYYDSVQRTVSIDPEGRKHGVERIYNSYGYSLEQTRSWQHGVQHGPETIMAVEEHKSFARSVTPWQAGVVHGSKRVYHVNGQIMSEVQYVEGQPVGTATSYDREGRITQTAEYKNGLRHGVMTDYWPEPRQIKRTVPYKKGLIDGVVRDYHPSGQLKCERPFRDDLLHGVERLYDLNGEVVQTRKWRDGDPVD